MYFWSALRYFTLAYSFNYYKYSFTPDELPRQYYITIATQTYIFKWRKCFLRAVPFSAQLHSHSPFHRVYYFFSTFPTSLFFSVFTDLYTFSLFSTSLPFPGPVPLPLSSPSSPRTLSPAKEDYVQKIHYDLRWRDESGQTLLPLPLILTAHGRKGVTLVSLFFF